MTRLPPAPENPPPARTAAGPVPLWRVWHPSPETPVTTTVRRFGPVARFDPHPAGPPADHGPRGPAVWYGSLAFDTAVCERLARDPSRRVVDLCPSVRGSLVAATGGLLVHDLTNDDACHGLGAEATLGDATHAEAYSTTQSWARALHPTAAGLRYHSARHRRQDGSRYGINVAVFAPAVLGDVIAQHRLIDDALWPHVVVALDAAGVALNHVPSCPRC